VVPRGKVQLYILFATKYSHWMWHEATPSMQCSPSGSYFAGMLCTMGAMSVAIHLVPRPTCKHKQQLSSHHDHPPGLHGAWPSAGDCVFRLLCTTCLMALAGYTLSRGLLVKTQLAPLAASRRAAGSKCSPGQSFRFGKSFSQSLGLSCTSRFSLSSWLGSYSAELGVEAEKAGEPGHVQ
jgi:hypothetical protein